jgi:hypothetical protein
MGMSKLNVVAIGRGKLTHLLVLLQTLKLRLIRFDLAPVPMIDLINCEQLRVDCISEHHAVSMRILEAYESFQLVAHRGILSGCFSRQALLTHETYGVKRGLFSLIVCLESFV